MKEKLFFSILLIVTMSHCSSMRGYIGPNFILKKDIIIEITHDQKLRILTYIDNRSLRDKSFSKLLLVAQNISDSCIAISGSLMDEGAIDSTFYINYGMTLEEQCKLLLLLPHSKVKLENTIPNWASHFVLSYNLIPNFSREKYSKFLIYEPGFTVNGNAFIWIGIKSFPPDMLNLEVNEIGARIYKI